MERETIKSYYAGGVEKQRLVLDKLEGIPENIDAAKAYSKDSGIELAGYEVGDATNMSMADSQFDLALLMGPLYQDLVAMSPHIIVVAEKN